MTHIYIITKTWVNWDGWPIGSAEILKTPTFADEIAARVYASEQNELAPNQDRNHDHYGVASVEVPL